LCTHDLNLRYGATEIGLTLLLIAFLVTDRSRSPSVSSIAQQDRPMLPATNGNYWLAMLTAGTLGTASTAGTTLGDLLASRHGFDLGLPLSTTLTASMLALIVLFWPHPSSVVPIAKGRRGSFSGNGCFASPALRRLDEIRTNHGY
jgi:uncharacterized membrane-anchored protein